LSLSGMDVPTTIEIQDRVRPQPLTGDRDE